MWWWINAGDHFNIKGFASYLPSVIEQGFSVAVLCVLSKQANKGRALNHQLMC